MANWSENAKVILESRYLIRDKQGNILETPDEMLKRVTKHISKAERTKKLQEYWEDKFMSIMDTLEFLPNSPTLINAGRELGMLSACFVFNIEDNLSNILEMAKKTALVHKKGGGTGLVFSHIRPKNSRVLTTSGVSSGPVSFMKIFNIVTEVIKQGGVRRGANLGLLSIDHPDIYEFISCKHDTNNFQNFNISVSITDNFIKSVERNDKFMLKDKFNKEKTYVNARELFDLICKEAWYSGEPGLIFIDSINRKNTTPWLGKLEGVNPCITGDTLIAVADGRNSISIKELAEDKKDFLVYSQDLNAASKGKLKVVVKKAYNPRITRKKAEVYQITLDDGSILKTTREHLFMMRDGTWKKAIDLKFNDSLMPFNTSIHNGYVTINSNGKYWKRQFRYIWEFENNKKQPLGFHIHHKDRNKLNDFIDNLELISIEEHKKIHDISGEKNPLNILKRKGKFEEYKSRNSFYNTKGQNNPRWIDGRSIFKESRFCEYCNKEFTCVLGSKKMFCSISCSIKSYWNKKIEERICLYCNKIFSVEENSNQKFCSRKCSTSSINSRRTKHRLVVPINHKVVSVKFYGLEDVYNFEVEDTSNFMVITNYHKDNSSTGVCLHNCGEAPLLSYESCNLGSIDVSKLVKNKKVDWDRLFEIIPIAVRFLDDTIDVNKYPSVRIERKTKLTRKIGLGIMGWADMLISLGIKYGSKESFQLAEKLMMNIRELSHITSRDMGKEKKYCFRKLKRRNSILTTIAPTGTLSLLADCSASIEPIFGKKYTKTVLNGTKLDLGNKYNDIDDDLLITSHDISVKKHLEMQSSFQRYTDNAVSKTINLKKSATVEDVKEAFLLAHDLELKGCTVYREGSRDGPLQITTEGQLSECDNGKCVI